VLFQGQEIVESPTAFDSMAELMASFTHAYGRPSRTLMPADHPDYGSIRDDEEGLGVSKKRREAGDEDEEQGLDEEEAGDGSCLCLGFGPGSVLVVLCESIFRGSSLCSRVF
jgi:hypothetical protein